VSTPLLVEEDGKAHLGYIAEGLALCDVEDEGIDGPVTAAMLGMLTLQLRVAPKKGLCLDCWRLYWAAMERQGRVH
jgi:hypothetical protein